MHDLEDLYIRAARLIHNISPSIPKNEVLAKAKCYSLSYLYTEEKIGVHCLSSLLQLSSTWYYKSLH